MNAQGSRKPEMMRGPSFRVSHVAVALATLALAACATAMPPKELVDARAAYSEAERSDAARFDPAALHQAKTKLDEAEASFAEDADSPQTRDAAYIAMRRSERAKVEAETVSLEMRKTEALRAANQAQAKSVEQTQAQLASTRAELGTAQDARAEAEERAKQAMMNLKLSQAAAVAEEPRGTVITIGGAFLFRSEETALMPAAGAKLDKIVEAIKEQPNRKILIEGHTDSRGADAYNLNLSKQRAESVASYLTSHGVPSDKVSATGVGSGRPVASNDTTEGRASNRRVEITLQRTEPR